MTEAPVTLPEPAAPPPSEPSRRGTPTSRRGHWIAVTLALPTSALIWLFAAGPMIKSEPFVPAIIGPLLALLVVSTWTDMTRKRIYNWITYPCFLFGIGLNLASSVAEAAGISLEPSVGTSLLDAPWWQRLGAVGLLNSVLGATIGFFSIYLVYNLSGKKGAGDVKLATGLGAMLGVVTGMMAILYTYVIAGVVLGVWVLLAIGPGPILGYLLRAILHAILPGFFLSAGRPAFLEVLGRPVPMGAFFLAGTGTAMYLKG